MTPVALHTGAACVDLEHWVQGRASYLPNSQVVWQARGRVLPVLQADIRASTFIIDRPDLGFLHRRLQGGVFVSGMKLT